jgi:hypothetical protein
MTLQHIVCIQIACQLSNKAPEKSFNKKKITHEKVATKQENV